MDETPYKSPQQAKADTSAQRWPWRLLLVGLCLCLALISAGIVVAGASLLIYWKAGQRSVAESSAQQDVQLVPLSDKRPLTASSEQVVVSIDAAGTFSLDGRRVSVAELEESLQQLNNDNAGNFAVKIHSDRNAPFHSYIEAVNVCSKVGITDAALVTAGEP